MNDHKEWALCEGEDILCDRCGRDITFETKHKGDEEFDEKLCDTCWAELGELSNHNRPILRSLGCKVWEY